MVRFVPLLFFHCIALTHMNFFRLNCLIFLLLYPIQYLPKINFKFAVTLQKTDLYRPLEEKIKPKFIMLGMASEPHNKHIGYTLVFFKQ